MFCAIIGDIVQSRKFNERSKIQDKLRAALDSINEEYDELIASKFIITLGDEFQGLLKTTDKLIDIIDRIVMEMHPVKIRIGIGIGDILTEINKEMSLGADGPAYHNARKMLDEMKKNSKGKMAKDTYIKLCSGSKNDDLINVVFTLCSYIEKKWTNRQREIVYDYLKNGGNQKKAAERLGIAQSNIQRGLKNSGFYNYFYARKIVQETLTKVWGELIV